MKTVTITIKVDSNEVYRNYDYYEAKTASEETWGERVVDMFDTLEKSNEKEF